MIQAKMANRRCGCRDKSRVADRVLEKEKNRQIGQVFDAGFKVSEMLDAVADVYMGVSATSML